MPTNNIPRHVLLTSNEEIENEHLRAIDRHCDNALDAIGQLCEEIAKLESKQLKRKQNNVIPTRTR